MQLVLSNNRVIAHGENFLSMGGVVINTETGKKYENATIAECNGCPSDIDKVGYEYHAGAFVPCAPFGVGTGNVAILCNDDCKAIKDSGIPIGRFAQSERTTYRPTYGTSGVSLSFNINPDVIFITTTDYNTRNSLGVILGTSLICIGADNNGSSDTSVWYSGAVTKSGNTVSWSFSGEQSLNFQSTNVTYNVYAFGK